MAEQNTTAPIACDTLILGGLVITLDPDDRIISDSAIAVRGDRIVEIGKRTELIDRYTATQHIDASDQIILPGLVNTHNHTPLMIVRGMVEDLNFAPAYTPHIPQGHKLSAEECYLLSRLGMYELLRFGSTTVVDYYRHPQGCAQAMVEVGLRGLIGGRIHDADPEKLAQGQWHYEQAIGAHTLQESLDLIEQWHDPNGRIQCILAPHAPDTCSDALWQQIVELAEQFPDLTIHTHLAQSKAEVEQVRAKTGCSSVELLDQLGLLNSHLVAAHCIWLEPDEIARLGSAQIRVAHVPVGNASSGTIAPAYDLMNAGATVTLATDTKSADLFEAMRMAIAVARIRGADYDLKAESVLRWATLHGAEALGMAADIGSLTAGKKADLILLDATDPNLCPVIDGIGIVVHSGCGANVDTVLIDGEIVLQGGKPTRFDGEEVVKTAQAIARRLWSN